MPDNDIYQFFGVSRDATNDEIKSAYRKLAKKYHPDTGSEKDDQKMKDLITFYQILSDPIQRKSYDESTSYSYHKKNAGSHKRTTHTKAKTEEYTEPEPENYFNATFVNGIEAVDSKNNKIYINVSDFIYYPVVVKKKFLFFEYNSKDYYRVNVSKIYSRKHNSFRHTPLFQVYFSDMIHIVFEDDFRNYWLSYYSFMSAEKQKGVKSLVIGLVVISALLYFLLHMQ